MPLAELTVTQLRCIEHAELETPPGLALIYGGNGSGKTSLLEAIFLLGRGRSFRTRNSERLIQRGQDHLRVTGRVMSPSGQAQSLGFEVTRAGTSARIGGGPARDRKSTRLNSSHLVISYAVFCLKKKKRRHCADFGCLFSYSDKEILSGSLLVPRD